MDKRLVEDIKIKLASGIYDDHSIFVGLLGRVSKEEYDSIKSGTLGYDIRSDLNDKVYSIGVLKGIVAEYQDELRYLAVESMRAEEFKRDSGYMVKKLQLDEVYQGKLKSLDLVIPITETGKFLN